MLKPNDALPQFSLPDQTGAIRTNADYAGKWLLIYFYPKDDTPGCTKEACSFRDNYDQFQQKGIAVVGISKDSVKSHQKFQAKYHLPFTLLSDETTAVMQTFGVWGQKKFMGREYLGALRTTFLVNPKGKIVKVYENVTPTDHAEQILSDFASENA